MERINTILKFHIILMNFIKVHYQPMLNKYAYHSILLRLLGKYECKNIRNEDFLEDNNAVMS